VAYTSVLDAAIAPAPLSIVMIGDLLRHALGLSAWKAYGASRWSLRVNPSSGNLHPTEAYVICGELGLMTRHAVYHYAADAHALELRCAFASDESQSAVGAQAFLVALTSIHWREAWKYGERAFRYCQHDVGHAIAALELSARIQGWRARLLPSWSHRAVAALTGTDRSADFVEAEREEPGCLLAMTPGDRDIPPGLAQENDALIEAVCRGVWTGRASQLSGDHVDWTFIDEIAAETRDPGRLHTEANPVVSAGAVGAGNGSIDARALVLRRRSAVAFDARSVLPAAAFFDMLSRLMPVSAVPWHALWWRPRVHLLIMVHRLEGLAQGLYLLGRDPAGAAALRSAFGRQTLDERAHDTLPLTCLARGDCRSMARRLSCDQDIAADGFFSLAMIADFDAALDEYGSAFYRHLFWESGVVGQVLYLEAEAGGARGTGIGCFYDDAVHDVLGLSGHAFQSLYHFAVGMPVEDVRLTIEPGYSWERS
jgi:SagB-type dehydrogenase family enzyme